MSAYSLRFSSRWCARGIEDGSFHASIDPALPFYIIRDAIVSIARWFDPQGRLSIEEFAEQYVTVFMHGVCRSKK